MEDKEIVKVCKVHGELKLTDCYELLNNVRKKKYLCCKKCTLAAQIKYRKSEKGKNNYRKGSIKWKNKTTNKQKEYQKKYKNRMRLELSDTYIKTTFNNIGLRENNITKEILDLKRLQIEIFRKCKQLRERK